MKKLKEKSMTNIKGGDYCTDVLTIMGGALDRGDLQLAYQAFQYYTMHCT